MATILMTATRAEEEEVVAQIPPRQIARPVPILSGGPSLSATSRRMWSIGSSRSSASDPLVSRLAGALVLFGLNGAEMVEIPAGRFRMGAVDFYLDERSAREVETDAFAIQRGPVTVAQLARFVDQTGYVTLAERVPDPVAYPDADSSLLVPGSAVFHPTPGRSGCTTPLPISPTRTPIRTPTVPAKHCSPRRSTPHQPYRVSLRRANLTI